MGSSVKYRTVSISSTAIPLPRVAMVLLSFLLFSCGTLPDPPTWNKVISTRTLAPVSANPTMGQLVIYIDESASMAGYVSSDGQSMYGRTLQALRDVASTTEPFVGVLTRRVDATVRQPNSDMNEIARAAVDAKMYNGADTDLAGTISSFANPVGASAGERHPARFHVLVTDGVQSTTGSHGGNCETGSDEVCIREKILNLLRAGWGGCALGIRSQFHGKVYSEINRARGGKYGLRYDTIDNDPATFRPFYLYLFSPDEDQLDKMVTALKRKLASFVGAGGLRELALTLPYTSGQCSGDIEIPAGSREFLKRIKPAQAEPGRMTLRVSLDAEKGGPKPFSVKVRIPWSGHATDMASLAELAQMVRWELIRTYPKDEESLTGTRATPPERVRYPEAKVVGSMGDSNGDISVEMTAFWPPGTGKLGWSAYNLSGHLELQSDGPTWIHNQEWSTDLDTSPEMSNKTLYLQSTLLNLWRNDRLETRTLADLYIRVGPQ